MKYLTLFLFSVALQAATYYVSSAGSDSNDGSQGSPWLTLDHAVNTVACGDTINVVANGNYVKGDANLPPMPNCGTTTTVQSSALAQFAPVGYRTNPASDCPNPATCLYGKLQFAAQGIDAVPEVHGSEFTNQNYGGCGIASITGIPLNTFTLGYCGSGLAHLANGSQVEMEIQSAGHFAATAIPAPLTILQHYYVVNCTGICGTTASTLQLSATSGGLPITITACDSNCLGATLIFEPLQFTVGSTTITSPDTFSYTNGTPVTLASTGLQLFGTLPTPFQLDTFYYIVRFSGRDFGLATTPGGSPIRATSVGLGPSMIANANLAHNWAFRGLELVEKPGSLIYNLFLFGTGTETSVYGMVNRMEVDRCWLHDNPTDVSGPNRGIGDNGTYLYVHDSYIAGMRYGENQAIAGWGSPGPTAIVNNFLEAASEVTLYGGNVSSSGVANANKNFIGNYYYKPPLWKTTSSTNPASGPCLYDATDPSHAGGEWYTDTNASQNYQCGNDNLWHTTTATVPTAFTVKNMAEHKNGRYFLYYGNLMNYSWAAAQSGQAFATHQNYDSSPGLSNDHITIMNNKSINVFNYITQDSHCLETSAVHCTNFPSSHTIANNLVVVNPLACGVGFATGSATCGYHMTPHSWAGYPETGEFWNHNTIAMPDGGLFSATAFAGSTFTDLQTGAGCTNFPMLDSWTYKNSIISYDFTATCFNFTNTFPNLFTHLLFTNNALIASPGGGQYSTPGATNTVNNIAFPANTAAMNYVSAGTGDYHLASTSPYSAANAAPTLLSDDGTDLGADIDMVNMATSGAMAGTPSWDQQAGLRVNSGSSQVVFRYTAPTADACTATLYSAPARIAGNQVASVADSSANSISDALTRELYISGLQPSTLYWYKLACGGGVLMVGNLLTRTPGLGTVQFGFDWNSPTPMQYSSSASMSSPVSLPAATRQFIPVAANSVIYAQMGTTGSVTILITP
jgi:hypothetical protein